MSTNRYFRTSPTFYDATRDALDAVFGHPRESVSTGGIVVHTTSCLPALEDAPKDSLGRVLVSLRPSETEMEEVITPLNQALLQGVVEELNKEEYYSILSTIQSPI